MSFEVAATKFQSYQTKRQNKKLLPDRNILALEKLVGVIACPKY